MKYLFLVFQDEAIVKALPECRRHAIADEATAYREQRRQDGHLLAASTLQPAATAVTVRVRNGEPDILGGSITGTNGCLAEVWLVAARDLNQAIRLAARMPQACLGSIEVRPLEQEACNR